MKIPRKFKYIIFSDFYGNECPVLFPEHIEHSQLKDSFSNIVSAGFADIIVYNDVIKVSAFGKSTGLNIESREKDSSIIERMITKEI